ncbi:MAG: protein kinase [Anaerolineales bacterium]|nr:protein kinase [Anaerolineales bacterium]
MAPSLSFSEKYSKEGKKQKHNVGSSYRGRNTNTDQMVWIVEVDGDLIPAQEFQTQFELLADTLAGLNILYGIPLVEYGDYQGQILLVYQYAEGQTLSEMLKDSDGLPVNLVLDLLQQIGEFIQGLHEAEWVHGWLNSDNIALTSQGSIKVKNIGLAQAVGLPKLLSEGKLAPEPYQSPEIVAGGQLSVLSDFYALGVLLYQLLTGQMPGDGKDSWPGSIRPGIPPEVDELVAKCLNADPARRVQSAYEFLDYVEQARQGMNEGMEETILGMEDSLVGQTLGGYRLVERLGQGGMATVYKAYEAALGRYVAVKVLPQFFARDPSFMRRFQREAKAVAQLSHPNIVPIHTYGEHGNITYIVMQYIEGGTLKKSRGNVMNSAEALELLLPVVRALNYAHQRGIVHRDVKPSNILLTEGEWPMLADFGLAQMAEASVQLTGTGVGIGTPMYMSPEQGQGAGVDQRTDIYSMGIVLYELLTGDVPFRADTPMAVVIKHMTAPMPPPRQVNSDIPEVLEEVILKATAKEPEHRYQSAEEMAQAMEAALGELRRSPEVAPELETSEPQAEQSPARPSRTPLFLGILGIVLLAALGVFLLTGGRGEAMIGALGLRPSTTLTATLIPPTETPLPTSTLTATPEPPTPTSDHIATQMARAEATAAARDDRLVFQENVSDSAITSLDWSDDGILAVASGSNNVYFLESLDQGDLSSIDMRRGIYSLDWQPGKDTLTMGTTNGIVLLFGYTNQSDQEEIIAGSGNVVDVEWSGDGRFLAAAMDEGFVRSWNYSSDSSADRALPAVLSEFVEKISWSADGSKVMILRENDDGTVYEINADESHSLCQAADLSQDGNFVSCGFTETTAGDDGIVDLNSDVSVRRESQQDSIASSYGSHFGFVYQLEFSPDGEFIATAGEDGTLRIWTGIEPLDRFHDLTQLFKFAPNVDIYHLAWSPDGSYLAAGDVNGNVWIWNVGENFVSTNSSQDGSIAEQANEFAEPILAAIKDRPADYEEDFDNPASGWPVGSTTGIGEWGYEDGAYFISAESNTGSAPEGSIWFSDFVMEVEAEFISGDWGFWYILFRDFPVTIDDPSAHYGVAFGSDSKFMFYKNLNGAHIDLLDSEIVVPGVVPVFGKNKLLIVAMGPKIAVYLNEEPIWFAMDDSSTEGGFGLGVENDGRDPLRVHFENIKVWDLTDSSSGQSNLSLEYSDDFEVGFAEFWNTSNLENWRVEEIEGRNAARGVDAIRIHENLTDFEFIIDFRFAEPYPGGNDGIYRAAFLFRGGFQCVNDIHQAYELEMFEHSATLNKNSCNDGPTNFPIDYPQSIRPDEWHNVRVRMVGNQLSVWMDDVQVLDVVDEGEAISEGIFALGVHEQNTTYFDNFKLEIYDSGE